MTKKCCVSAHRETCSLSPIVISVYTSVATLAHGDILWQKKKHLIQMPVLVSVSHQPIGAICLMAYSWCLPLLTLTNEEGASV